jgi:formylglycine-generating enzyme required for sulfatase activity
MGWNQGAPEERPAHAVHVETFCLGRTPVTNQDFLAFLAADGYRQEDFWLPDGWQWIQQKQIRAPAFWGHPQFGRPEQPIVGVTWYEAMAFATWLAAETGQAWRLPSEAEWEKAARGGDERLWPWGNHFDVTRANVADSGLGAANAVMAFPQGATPDGLLDMAGNVWEWTVSRWGRAWQSLEYHYPYAAPDGREDLQGRFARVMRGGSWFDRWQESRATKRGRYLPGSRASNIGFRLAGDCSPVR